MKIILAKFNRERLPKFQIVTKIIELTDGNRKAVKEALTPEAKSHIAEIYANYIGLTTKYPEIKLVPPNLESERSISFPMAEGDCFEQLLIKSFDSQKREVVDKFLNYVDSFVTQRQIKFEPCERFKQIFGEWILDDQQDLIDMPNVDITFSNLFLDAAGRFLQIDYEWVFDFAVPKKFIIFRAIHNFEIQFSHSNKSFCSALYDICEISADEVDSFIVLERQFQKFVFGEAPIKPRLLKRQTSLTGLNILETLNYAECFIDFGDGFKQEEAIQQAFSNASEIVFVISKFNNIQKLRFDPTAIPSQVKLVNAKLVDEQNQEINLPVGSHNANWTDGHYYNFYHDDPQFIFDIPDVNKKYDRFIVEFTVSPFDVHQISEHVNWATRRIDEVEQLMLQQQTRIDELTQKLEIKGNTILEKDVLLELANKQVAKLSIERENLSFRIESEYQQLQSALENILENSSTQENVKDNLLFHRDHIKAKLILLHEKLTASSEEIQRLNCIIQEQMHNALISLQDELVIQREKNIALNQQITELLTSASWKITKPLRRVRQWITPSKK